jgi:hypothetical protein
MAFTLVAGISAAEIASISFREGWTLSGAVISGDTLIVSGNTGSYSKAQRKVSITGNPANLYFIADIILENIVQGELSTSLPKFKIYDGDGTSIKAFNIVPLVQDEWYTNGMVISGFSGLGENEITLEFGIQECEGNMKVLLPKLLDAAPQPDYSFPFDIPSSGCAIELKSNEKLQFNDNLLSANSHFVSSTSVTWSDRQVMQILAQLLPLGNLRFPAGTVGNFYDWETDGFYGDEWTFLSARRRQAFESGFCFDYPGFLDNVKALDASATLMFNMLRDSPDKSAAQLSSRLADGLLVDYVELGNENYFPDQAFGNVDSPQKYISHTKEVTAALKSVKSDIQIAVNTDRHNYLAGSWNDLLSKENYYDACVMHPYTNTGTFLLNKPALQAVFGAYRSTKEAFAEHKKMFPGKPLLLSEWNIFTEGAPSYFAQALGVADQFLAIAEGGDEGLVVQAGLHMFCLSEENTESTLYFGTAGNLQRTRLAVVYEKIVTTFKGRSIYRARGTSASLAENLPAVNCRALDCQDSISIFAVNKLPVESPLSVTLDGIAYTGDFQMESFSEPMVGVSAYSLSDNPWKHSSGTGAIILAPSSIAVVSFPKSGLNTVKGRPVSFCTIFLKGAILTFPCAAIRKVELYGVNGRKVFSREMTAAAINLGREPIAAGIYSIRVNENGKSIFKGRITL